MFYCEYNKYIFPIEKGDKNAVYVKSSSASEWMLHPPYTLATAQHSLTRQVELWVEVRIE